MEPKKSSFSNKLVSFVKTTFVQSGYDLSKGCPDCSGPLTLNLGPLIQCEHCLGFIKICPEVCSDD